MSARIHLFALVVLTALTAHADGPAKPLKYPKKQAVVVPKGPRELPDPAPLYANGRHRIGVKWDKQTPSIVAVDTMKLSKPESVERWAGRFAFELFERGLLIERVRFNFPMLGAEPQERGMAAKVEENLSSTTEVSFPAIDRGDKFELVDRATGKRWQVSWPFTPHVILRAKPEGPPLGNAGK